MNSDSLSVLHSALQRVADIPLSPAARWEGQIFSFETEAEVPDLRTAQNPAARSRSGLSFTWDRDSLDWKGISAAEITKRVTSKVGPGSIVLFHNAGEHTPEALPEILRYFAKNGYKTVPISEILLDGPYTLDHEGRQHAAPEEAR